MNFHSSVKLLALLAVVATDRKTHALAVSYLAHHVNYLRALLHYEMLQLEIYRRKSHNADLTVAQTAMIVRNMGFSVNHHYYGGGKSLLF